MRPGDKINLRHKGKDLRGYVVEALRVGFATVAIHGDDGVLLFSVTDAPIAEDDADQLVDGNIWIRS